MSKTYETWIALLSIVGGIITIIGTIKESPSLTVTGSVIVYGILALYFVGNILSKESLWF